MVLMIPTTKRKGWRIMRIARQMTGVAAVLARVGTAFRGSGQEAAKRRNADARLVNPAGERPEHQRLSKATFRLIKEDGQILEEIALKRSQLTPPAR